MTACQAYRAIATDDVAPRTAAQCPAHATFASNRLEITCQLDLAGWQHINLEGWCTAAPSIVDLEDVELFSRPGPHRDRCAEQVSALMRRLHPVSVYLRALIPYPARAMIAAGPEYPGSALAHDRARIEPESAPQDTCHLFKGLAATGRAEESQKAALANSSMSTCFMRAPGSKVG